MRLLILSNMAHYHRNGEIVGHGATAREIDHLATLFDEVVHVACLYEEQAPASALPYSAPNVRLCAVPPAGGNTVADKFQILRLYPHYARVILRELRKADAVHVRCPANISLLAVLLLSLLKNPKKRWIKYAGNWQAYKGEPWSYTFQRWWLNKGWAGAEVSVNGQWPDQPAHVHTFLNPCLTDEELDTAEKVAVDKQMAKPLKLLYVGRLEREKGVERTMRIVAQLHERGLSCTLELVGDGPQRQALESLAREIGVEQVVTFHGWQPRTVLGSFYEAAHFFLMPSICSEGWPKVLSEGMAYGVVPLASTVSSIPQYLHAFETGRAIDAEDVRAYVDKIEWYLARPTVWKKESMKGVAAAGRFTYTTYLQAVRRLFLLQDNEIQNSRKLLWPSAIPGQE